MFHSSLHVPALKSANASFAKSSSSPFCVSSSNSLSHFRFSKVENQSRNVLKSFRDKLVTALSISVNVVIMRLVPFAKLFGLPILSLYLQTGRFGNRNFKELGRGLIQNALRVGNLSDNRDSGRIPGRHRLCPYTIHTSWPYFGIGSRVSPGNGG